MSMQAVGIHDFLKGRPSVILADELFIQKEDILKFFKSLHDTEIQLKEFFKQPLKALFVTNLNPIRHRNKDYYLCHFFEEEVYLFWQYPTHQERWKLNIATGAIFLNETERDNLYMRTFLDKYAKIGSDIQKDQAFVFTKKETNNA